MANPIEQPPYSPLRQVPTPEGGTRDSRAEPTRGEKALQMWRDYMGDEEMPDYLKRFYGLPAPPVRVNKWKD